MIQCNTISHWPFGLLLNDKTYLFQPDSDSKQVPVILTAAERALATLQNKHIASTTLKMRNAHFVAKTNKSYRDYTLLNELDKAKGLDVSDLYAHHSYAPKMVQSIADATRRDTKAIFLKNTYLSVTMDGTSDFIGEEIESFYARTAGEGVVSDRYLAIKTPKSSSSSDLYDLFVKTMGEFFGASWRQKFLGFCSDGASNMMGRITGLATRLQEDSPHLVKIHCIGHRVELAVKDCVKKSASPSNHTYDRLQTLLLGIYYLYRNSPRLKNGYRQACDAMQLKMLMPKRAGGTRWLSHILAAINVLLKNYVALRTHLETASHDGSMMGFSQMLWDYFVRFI